MIFEFQTLLLALSALALVLVAAWLWHRRQQRLRQVLQEGRFLQTPLGPLFYQVFGHSGPTRVFIHGLGASTFCWREIAPAFQSEGRSIVYDLWGFGQSAKSQGQPITLDAQVDFFLSLLNHLKLARVDLVGHSMGGEIALWIAKCHPERVRSLVLIAPAVEPKLVSTHLLRMGWLARWTPLMISEGLVTQVLRRLIHAPKKIDGELIGAYFAPYKEASAHQSFALAMQMIRDSRVKESLAQIRQPCLILWGQADRIVSLRVLKSMEKRLPSYQTQIHPWGGHLLMEDDPVWIVEATKKFWQDLSRPS